MSERSLAIVTGGSRGIGRAICIQLAKDGFDVLVNFAGNEEAAEDTAIACEKAGARAYLCKASVADELGVETIFSAAADTGTPLGVLVNNAGITKDGLLISMKEEDFDAVLDTNLKGTFLCSKLAAKLMLRSKKGRIINLSSVVGLHGNAGQSNYCASKAGVIGFTKSLAKELAAKGITVNAIAPGYISTDMTDAMPDAAKAAVSAQIPMKRPGTPEDIAKAVSFLASDSASYITGQVLGVDGGMGM